MPTEVEKRRGAWDTSDKIGQVEGVGSGTIISTKGRGKDRVEREGADSSRACRGKREPTRRKNAQKHEVGKRSVMLKSSRVVLFMCTLK